MKEFRELFSIAVKKSGRHPKKIAQALDRSENYVYAMMRGERTPSEKLSAAIAEQFSLNLRNILDSIHYQKAPDHLKKDFEKTEDLKVSVAATKQEPAQTKIPLIAYVSAGKPFESEASEFEWIDLPMGVRPDEADRYYAVRVRGTSMLPFLKDGATLIVQKSSRQNISDSDIAIYRDTDNNCWVKHVQFSNDLLIFKSFNPAYSDIVKQKSDVVQMERVECVIF